MMPLVERAALLLMAAVALMASCGNAEEDTIGEERVLEPCPNDGVNVFNQSSNSSTFLYGLSANIAAVLLFGSCTVPIKRIETGDGMFFYWVSCAAIWIVSKVGDLLLRSPTFYPLAMLGGAIWATGNIAVVTIIKSIGLGLGILIWGSFSLLMGWTSSRFGWFWIVPQQVSRPILNYCGAGLCLLSGMIFFFVKSDVALSSESETVPLLIDRKSTSGSFGRRASQFWVDALRPRSRRFMGCLLAVMVGLLYGSCFIPILYIMSHSPCPDSVYYGASVFAMDYVYAQNCGIFLTSTVYFVIYCAVRSNKPRVYSRAILPGFLSGLMWSVGTYCWFLANNYLSPVITYPIVTAGYGLVAALWGSLVFKEIKGVVNCSIFFLASCVVLTGSLLTALSKLL